MATTCIYDGDDIDVNASHVALRRVKQALMAPIFATQCMLDMCIVVVFHAVLLLVLLVITEGDYVACWSSLKVTTLSKT